MVLRVDSHSTHSVVAGTWIVGVVVEGLFSGYATVGETATACECVAASTFLTVGSSVTLGVAR